jgi:hypothetical protein
MKKFTLIVIVALTTVCAIIAGNRSAVIAGQFSPQAAAAEGEAEKDSISEAIAKAIVARADVPVTFENDEVYPWTIEDYSVKNGNYGHTYSSSTLTMSYSSSCRTVLSFYWKCYNYSNHFLCVLVDGVQKETIKSSPNSTYEHFNLEPGQHVIVFKDSIGSSKSEYLTYNWTYIQTIMVKELRPLETVALSEKSKPLTFENEDACPWTIENGYIQNGNYAIANSSSEFSTSFTIDKPCKFSFDQWVNRHDENTTDASKYHTLYLYINGAEYIGQYYTSGWATRSVALAPGDYKITLKDEKYSTSSSYYSRIKNIELTDDCLLNVELSTAGTLGVEVLYLVDVLQDVEMLKVKGPMNSTDWATIQQMTNLKGLDLSEAQITVIPDSAFYEMTWLSSIQLPEGLQTIGEYAFRSTKLLNIDIPSSVISIGGYAFYGDTRLSRVSFKDDAQLQTIGTYAFYGCSSLKEFIMPNTVTKLELYNTSNPYTHLFDGCTSLTKVHFSDALTDLDGYVCNGCSSLTDVHLPKKIDFIGYRAFYNCTNLRHIELPSTLRTIRSSAFYGCGLDSICLPIKLSTLNSNAFQDCKNLKYIELPSNIGSYNYNFKGCTAVETVVSRSATPPLITDDPFYGRSKSAITLKVPSFAIVDYKLDSYWYQFGNIVEDDNNIDYLKISTTLSLENNRRVEGKPDIDLYYGGQFTVGGNAPMEIGLFKMYVSQGNPGRLLNYCDAVTADSLNTYFSVSANTWYFLTPLHDVDLKKVRVSNSASYVFRYYDGSRRATNGTGSNWRNVESGKLTAGQGYIFCCNADALITFPAEAEVHAQVFNTADVTTPLKAYESSYAANKSWNYVGNPYPCYYDIYYMDFTAPITVWTGSTYKAYSIADDSYALRPMQSFFVQKPDALDSLVFHKEGRQLTASVNHADAVSVMCAPAQGSRYLFDIRVAGDGLIDETRVVINDNASADYEIACDASKFMSSESANPQIFTSDNFGNSYAINERPLADGVVKLSFYAGQAGFYTISATRSDGAVYLYDSRENKTVDLGEQDYIFHSDATDGVDDSRFELRLKVDPADVTAIESIEDDSRRQDDAVYDLLGRKVQHADKGIYIRNGQKVVK